MKEYKPMVEVELDRLIGTLQFLGDKIEDCYKRETDQLIKRLIEELNNKEISKYTVEEYED